MILIDPRDARGHKLTGIFVESGSYRALGFRVFVCPSCLRRGGGPWRFGDVAPFVSVARTAGKTGAADPRLRRERLIRPDAVLSRTPLVDSMKEIRSLMKERA